jgi:hypothetical protein
MAARCAASKPVAAPVAARLRAAASALLLRRYRFLPAGDDKVEVGTREQVNWYATQLHNHTSKWLIETSDVRAARTEQEAGVLHTGWQVHRHCRRVKHHRLLHQPAMFLY